MWRSIIGAIVAALVVALLTWLASRKAPQKRKGMRALTWPSGTRVLAVILLIGSLSAVWAASQARPSQAVMAAIVSSTFVLASLYLMYCVFLYRVWWTTEGIGSWHPLGGERFIRWDEVEGGRYVGWMQAFVIHGAGRRIWYSPMHAGLGPLHRFIGRRLQAVNVADGRRL